MFGESINPTYMIGVVLALVPPFTENNLTAKVYKVYAFLVSFLLLSLTIGSIYFRFRGGGLAFTLQEYGVVAVVLDMSLSFALAVSLYVCMLKASIYDSHIFMEFLRRYRNYPASYKKTWPLQVSLLHIAVILAAALNVYVGLHFGLFLMSTYLHLLLYRYCSVILVIIITNFALTLKCCICNLNMSLQNVKKSDEDVCTWQKVKEMRISFKKYSDLIKMFNTMFGWQMLFLTFTVSLEFLETVHQILWYFLHFKEVPDVIATGIVVLTLIWGITFLIMGIIIAVACNMTTREAKRVAAICYKHLSEIAPFDNTTDDKTLKEELILLAQHATHQCPSFSAADFFRMDHTMLFGLLGTVTSYIILLIQINK